MKWKTRRSPGAVAVGVAVAGYQLLRPGAGLLAARADHHQDRLQPRDRADLPEEVFSVPHRRQRVGAADDLREARPWAVAIKEEILEQRMPPWGAASGYGHFANDMSLTGREISLILSWADGGAPSGVLLVDEDKPPVFIPPLTGWEQGPPDAVISVAANQKIAADSPFRVERFEVDTGLKQARWLRALQLNPSDRRAIRYAAIYDARNGRWLGTWTPSSQVSAMPAGSGVQLPAAREAHRRDRLSRQRWRTRPAPASSACISPRSRRRKRRRRSRSRRRR